MEWNSALMNNIFPQLKNTPFVFVSSQLSENVDTVYGVQKRYGEVWTKLSQSGVCVRLWNLYGYNEDYTQRSHVVSDFVYQAMSLNKIDMLTDGEELRQFIHIDDVCSGLIKSFDINNRNETYDISNGIWVKLLDVAKLIQKYTGCQINIGNKKGETVYIQNKNYVPNWKPTVTLENGLKKMIESFKNVQ